MKYIFLLFSCFSFSQTTYVFDNFSGANPDAKWTTLRATVVSGDRVNFTSGSTYDFTVSADLCGLNGVTFGTTGANRAIIASANLDQIWRANNCDVNNQTFDNLFFNNTKATANHPPSAANLSYFTGVFEYITVRNCRFSTIAGINGFKATIYFEDRDRARYFYFEDNEFVNLGQMGAEFVNHRDDLVPGDIVQRYEHIYFRRNTFDSPGGFQYGMGLSMSGEGRLVFVEDNTFIDCYTTGIEFIGTDDSSITGNDFQGNTDPYHLVRGNGRINDNNLIDGNTGNVLGGPIFINVTNTTVQNDNITFADRFFMQGIKNMVFNNVNYTFNSPTVGMTFRAATSVEQEVHSDNGTEGLRIDNSNIVSLNANPPIELQGTHHAISLTVGCSSIRVASGTNYISLGGSSSVIYNNVQRYSGGVLQDTQNPGGAGNCLALPSTPNPPSTPNDGSKDVFYMNFFDN